MSDSLWPHGLYSPWNSPDQNTGVGSCSLLQGIFPTQGMNPGLPHCRWIHYQLSCQGSPRILGWVTYPFSSKFFWRRNRTGVSCIAAGFFTNWATREALKNTGSHSLLQGIFPTQGSNLDLLKCRWILSHLSYQGSPVWSKIMLSAVTWSGMEGMSEHTLVRRASLRRWHVSKTNRISSFQAWYVAGDWKSASLIAQLVENLPAVQETLVQFLGWEDLLEKG